MPRTTPAGSRHRPAALLACVALLLGGTVGCGSSDGSSAAAASSSPSATASAAGVLGVRDPWVKAADTGMTAAFGSLVNDGDTDVTITGAATDVSPMELHEMAMQDGQMVMRAKQGGIVVKARSTHVLEPGGDHLMLTNLRQPVRAGDQVSFTLTFADGRTQTFTAVAKPFTGAQESYAPGHGEPAPATSGQPATTTGPAS
ncbi:MULTISPECIES: copper chaperone PCu(A)C [unclassified Micromonospora]|uniref:copper chaperone PCu(A)C n=1 Tax=unclassified Micromonospora TaxID=2617518 RepID=UPI00331BE1FA